MTARNLTGVAAAVAAAATLAAPAAGSWTASARGNGFNRAKTIQATAVAAPTAVLQTTKNVRVTWSTAAFVEGGAITTYVVRRYPAAGGGAATIRAACAGPISALTCTENNVPAGSWVYTITPALGKWTGLESPRSLPIVTA